MDGDHQPRPEGFLSFQVLGQRVRFECTDRALLSLIDRNFRAMVALDEVVRSDLQYRVETGKSGLKLVLVREGGLALDCEDFGDLLYLLEHDLTVELQKRRPDLFFLHSAALDWRGKVCLLAAESGSGKSVTTWGLLHHGFRYLSDELSPIELESMTVAPYSHALNLKQPPAEPYPLPLEAVRLGRTIHIPVAYLPEETVSEPRPLGIVFLLEHRPELKVPEMRAMRPAEASARLYVNALNALAHPNNGLDAVVRIAEHVPCFAIASTELGATCALISSTVEQTVARGS